MILHFRSRLWLSAAGPGGWHFITLPPKHAKVIKASLTTRRGWGSLPVKATIGKTAWTTSIFPESTSQSYVLPVKAAVRRAEHMKEGDLVSVILEVRV